MPVSRTFMNILDTNIFLFSTFTFILVPQIHGAIFGPRLSSKRRCWTCRCSVACQSMLLRVSFTVKACWKIPPPSLWPLEANALEYNRFLYQIHLTPFWNVTSWWFQPIWKIAVKNGNLPQIGVKMKNIRNHHPGSVGWTLRKSPESPRELTRSARPRGVSAVLQSHPRAWFTLVPQSSTQKWHWQQVPWSSTNPLIYMYIYIYILSYIYNM